MLFGLYRILGTAVHILFVAVMPIINRVKPEWEIDRRLGHYTNDDHDDQIPLIWIHAASIGEVQAARAFIPALTSSCSGCRFFLTTMTRQGREVAIAQLGSKVRCELAPLDTPQAVARALRVIQPDIYICLETELWPMMLTMTKKAGVTMLLLNGRMSAQSVRSYQRIDLFMAKLLNGFAAIGVISEQDGERYRLLGADKERIQVCGNMKYDLPAHDYSQVEKKYHQILNLSNETVFICGSTRTGEEQLLLSVYQRLCDEVKNGLLWIIAPRHLERLDQVKTLLGNAGLEYDLFSDCRTVGRKKGIVLLDSIGELAELYSVGDFNFCGGSLVEKGGHNIMEPIRWQKPVYFGSNMKDFRDAVELVLSAGAGFQVDSGDALADCISAHVHNSQPYQQACDAATALAASQQGAVQRQADMVLQYL